MIRKIIWKLLGIDRLAYESNLVRVGVEDGLDNFAVIFQELEITPEQLMDIKRDRSMTEKFIKGQAIALAERMRHEAQTPAQAELGTRIKKLAENIGEKSVRESIEELKKVRKELHSE